MFSQLSALAKSATDFSLDNLQNDEDNANSASLKKKETKEKNEAGKTPPAGTSSDTTSDSSRFSNLFDNNSPTKHATNIETDTSLPSSSSSSFSSLFQSRKPSSTSSPTAPVSSSFNNMFDYRFNSGSSTTSKVHKDEEQVSMQGSKTDAKSLITSTPAPVDSTHDKRQIKQVTTNTNVDNTDTNTDVPDTTITTPVKVNSSPSKVAKKGSGREAAKLLETQLRGTISDLQASLNSQASALQISEDQLEQFRGRQEQQEEATAKHAQLLSQLSGLHTTVSELEESNSEVLAQKEELEHEVAALRLTASSAAAALQHQREQQANSEASPSESGGVDQVSVDLEAATETRAKAGRQC
jgi:hypothetical protein